jgi:hypothetical protein
VHRSRDERLWWRQAGIDPIKVARRLWRQTRGMGQRRSQRAAPSRSDIVAPSSNRRPENENISADATPREKTPLPDLPG